MTRKSFIQKDALQHSPVLKQNMFEYWVNIDLLQMATFYIIHNPLFGLFHQNILDDIQLLI